MNKVLNYKLSTIGFTIKPSVIKPKRVYSNHKRLSKVLYCLAVKTEEGWKAEINTKGLEGYQDKIILDFTETSFDLKGRIDVFYHHKDKYNHWIRVIRNKFLSEINPGSTDMYCTLCDGSIFSGHIVKVNNVLQFDMLAYKGSLSEYEHLLTRNNNKENDEE